MSLRVSGGELGGRRLGSPPKDVRPTTERVREAVFSMLGESIGGAAVLDLFCGSGAYAIEALSRGAAEAVLVDTSIATARGNVDDLGLSDRAEVVEADAIGFLGEAEEGAYDQVFCDPPYRLADRLAAELDPLIRRCLAEGGRVIAETSPDNPAELSLPLITERRYGDSLIRVHAAEEPS